MSDLTRDIMELADNDITDKVRANLFHKLLDNIGCLLLISFILVSCCPFWLNSSYPLLTFWKTFPRCSSLSVEWQSWKKSQRPQWSSIHACARKTFIWFTGPMLWRSNWRSRSYKLRINCSKRAAVKKRPQSNWRGRGKWSWKTCTPGKRDGDWVYSLNAVCWHFRYSHRNTLNKTNLSLRTRTALINMPGEHTFLINWLCTASLRD